MRWIVWVGIIRETKVCSSHKLFNIGSIFHKKKKIVLKKILHIFYGIIFRRNISLKDGQECDIFQNISWNISEDQNCVLEKRIINHVCILWDFWKKCVCWIQMKIFNAMTLHWTMNIYVWGMIVCSILQLIIRSKKKR